MQTDDIQKYKKINKKKREKERNGEFRDGKVLCRKRNMILFRAPRLRTGLDIFMHFSTKGKKRIFRTSIAV